MRAWRVHELGEPAQVLRLEDVGSPEPQPGQVRVRVLAGAANFPDVLMCRGLYQVRPPLPFTPGVELCGQVVALGPPIENPTARYVPAIGARVIGTTAMPHGGFAQEAVLDCATSFAAPSSLDDAQAAGLLIAYQTAWFALHRRAHLQQGETVLVHAAAGGVGSATVQLGRLAGARVIAVVGGAAKARTARELGADVVVDRLTQDLVAAVKAATGGRGADVVVDPVGGDAFEQSTRCIAFEGRLVVVGFASGTIPRPALGHALVKNYSLLGLHWGLYAQRDPAALHECHAELTRLADAGDIAPLVGERVPLEGAAAGLQRLADGTTVGRVTWVAAS